MDHLIRIELRCQDDARRASERLPIVVVGSGSSSISSGSSTCSRPSSKLKELNRNNNNIIKFHHEQESKMNCRQNKTSKSHTQLVQQQQQHQSASNSVGRSREKNNRPKSSNSHNNRSPTPTITVANGVGVLPVSSSLQLQHGPSSHSTISINGHQSHTFGSHRSTATDSSGFSSGASTTSCCGGQSQTMSLLLSPSDYHHHHQRTSMPNEQQQQQQPESRTNLIRSRLIEDLNRLEKIAAAALARKAQPDLQANTLSISPDDDNSRAPLSIDHPTMVNGVVQMSSAANTLSRGEFDYSTLCRDEFSSFIDYKARGAGFEGANHQAANTFVRKSSERDTQTGTRLKSGSRRHNRNGGVSKKRNQPGGPMLVGVHECERPRDTDCILSPGCSFASSSSSPADSERNLVFGGQSSPPCSEANSFATKDEDSSSSDSSYGDKHDNRHELTESGREEETLSSSHGEEVHVEENFSDDDNNSVTSSDGPPVESSRPKMNPREHEKLSGMLDVYLSRVESLLKLANGDKSVSLEELIEGCLNNGRCDDSSELIVRDEFKTTIAYVPRSDLPKFTKPRVIQEIEMLVETSEQDDTEDDDEDDHDKVKEGKETEKITTNLGTNYEALLSSPQTSAMLNWWPKQLSVTETELFSDLLNRPATTTSDDENNNQHFKKHAFIDQHQLRLLERSFFSRWLESEGGEPGNEKAYFESLTRTIRKHMSEFVANYNAYQETMRHETSFALDWHENWLFATNSRKCMPLKRAHQLSELSPILGPSSITATMSSTEDSPDQQQQEQQRLQMKRAKLMQSSSSSSALETNELLNYSTLLINKYKPVKVTFIDGIISTEEPSSFSNSRTKYEQQIDVCYEQEPDYLSELQQTSLELSGQVNVCHLLLNDLCDGPTVGDDMEHCAKRAKRSLEIEYESSLNGGRSLIDGQLLCFRAHGHLFELRKLRHFKSLSSSVEHKQKLNLLKKVILDRLCSACHWRPMAMAKPNNYSEASEAKLAYITRELPFEQYQQDQVRFLVPISDVQVSQALPVIQFCAKVAGALPIRVSWYRLLEDGSKQELSAESFKQSRTRASTTTNQDEWPVTMRANYELEYRNDWLSWYRFKREQGDILFEIRGAHLERDYGQTFECVIENYCSIKECTFKFELKRREPPPPKRKLINPALRRDANNRAGRVLASRAAATGRTRTREQQRELAAFEQDGSSEFDRVRLNKVEPASENQEAGQALLRTWSQRTLNKRAPLVAMDDHANITANDQANNNNNPSPSSFASTSSSAAHNLQILPGGINCQQPQLQTVGRLSAQAMNDCKFGTNYPYHPVSLMRRLEENKMSLTLRSRLRLASKRQIDDQRKVGGGGGRANTSDLSVGTVWDDDENANNNNNNKALESTCSPATGEKHNHDEQQANQEPRLSELEFSSPFAGTPNQSNRPEVRDCGNLDDASFRQTATFMRPSHRQLISNTTHNSEDKHSTSVLLLSDEPGNQDNAADGKDQQKSMDEDCERERIECQPMDHALKPMPRPRQKPMSLVAAAAISSRRLETEVGDDKPNPLFTRRQQPSTDDQHALAKSRSSDLPSSASASNDNDDNYPSSNYRQQSTHALNNSAHVPSIDLTTSRNTTQTPCQSSVDGDDLQTHHASQPTSTVKSRTTISTDATSNSRSESDARPKSVRSLISRFNTGCPSE